MNMFQRVPLVDAARGFYKIKKYGGRGSTGILVSDAHGNRRKPAGIFLTLKKGAPIAKHAPLKNKNAVKSPSLLLITRDF